MSPSPYNHSTDQHSAAPYTSHVISTSVFFHNNTNTTSKTHPIAKMTTDATPFDFEVAQHIQDSNDTVFAADYAVADTDYTPPSKKKAKMAATFATSMPAAAAAAADDAIVPSAAAAAAASTSTASAEAFPELMTKHRDACTRYSVYVAARLRSLMVERAPLTPEDLSFEEFKTEPTHIAVDVYMRRILKLAKAEASCALAALVYIERMFARCPGLEISNNNVRRIVFVAMMVASKSLTDIPFSNKYWAAISGTYHITALNRMERDMIGLLEWDVHIDRDTFAPLHAAAFADA